MRRVKNIFRNLAAVDVNNAAGRALWVDGVDPATERYAFSYTIQPQSAAVIVSDQTGAAANVGIALGSGEIWSQGDQEVRGSDIQMDLSKIFVRGNSDVVLLLEVPDDN